MTAMPEIECYTYYPGRAATDGGLLDGVDWTADYSDREMGRVKALVAAIGSTLHVVGLAIGRYPDGRFAVALGGYPFAFEKKPVVPGEEEEGSSW